MSTGMLQIGCMKGPGEILVLWEQQ